jgi:hypothetical protein
MSAAQTLPNRFFFISISSVGMGLRPAQKILLSPPTGNTRTILDCSKVQSS